MTELPIQRSRRCPSREAHSLQHVLEHCGQMSLLQVNRKEESNHCIPAADTESNGKLLHMEDASLLCQDRAGHCPELCQVK